MISPIELHNSEVDVCIDKQSKANKEKTNGVDTPDTVIVNVKKADEVDAPDMSRADVDKANGVDPPDKDRVDAE